MSIEQLERGYETHVLISVWYIHIVRFVNSANDRIKFLLKVKKSL